MKKHSNHLKVTTRKAVYTAVVRATTPKAVHSQPLTVKTSHA